MCVTRQAAAYQQSTLCVSNTSYRSDLCMGSTPVSAEPTCILCALGGGPHAADAHELVNPWEYVAACTRVCVYVRVCVCAGPCACMRVHACVACVNQCLCAKGHAEVRLQQAEPSSCMCRGNTGRGPPLPRPLLSRTRACGWCAPIHTAAAPPVCKGHAQQQAVHVLWRAPLSQRPLRQVALLLRNLRGRRCARQWAMVGTGASRPRGCGVKRWF